jgi:hypothetical protein
MRLDVPVRAIIFAWLGLVALTALTQCAGPPYPCWETVTCEGGGGGGGGEPSEGGVTDEGGQP